MNTPSLHFLALDVGRKHTGVAYADAKIAVALPLETIHHENDDVLMKAVKELATKRTISTVVLGLPLLLNGKEGEEAQRIHDIAAMIEEACPTCSIVFIDERETSKIYHSVTSKDRDAQAATMILRVFLERK